MYIGRTHVRNAFVIGASLLVLSSFLASSASAQTARRLSSNPNDLRDSFARHGSAVNTPTAFAKFVAQNDELRARYARHFGVPQERIVSFFNDSLVVYELPRTQTLTTYGVTRSGEIYPVKTTLPKGTRVWGTREGTPVLKWNCSNPLVAALPGASLTPPLELASTPSPVLPEGGALVPDVPETFAFTGSPSLAGDPSFAPIEPDAAFAFAVPTEEASSSSLPGIGEIIDAAGPSIKDFWPALLVPAFFAVANTDGNNTGVGEAPPFQQPPAVVIPESNTFGLLGMGLPILGVAGWIARRRK